MRKLAIILPVVMLAITNFALTARGLSLIVKESAIGFTLAGIMSYLLVSMVVISGYYLLSRPFSFGRAAFSVLIAVLSINQTSFFSFLTFMDVLAPGADRLEAVRGLLALRPDSPAVLSFLISVMLGVLTLMSAGLLALKIARPVYGRRNPPPDLKPTWLTIANLVFAVEIILASWFLITATIWWMGPPGNYEPQLTFVAALVAIIEIIKNRQS